MPQLTAEDVIHLLGLEPHPEEGGFFVETYRSSLRAPNSSLTANGAYYEGDRDLSTAIYFLITRDSFSEMHRLPGTEIFHHYAGDPISMLLIAPDGSGKTVTIGKDLANEERPQLIVPGGYWQGSRLARPELGWALIGCTMAPGFDFRDYERGRRGELTAKYPEFAAEIAALTRE